MRLILLRHGETDWNAQDRYQGRTDVALNGRGQAQARSAAAGPVGDLLQDADRLLALASPLARAVETARIVLESTVGSAEIELDPELMELHGGEWEGLALSEIAERWPREHSAWRAVPDLDAGPVGGELLRAGGARVLRAIASHVPAAWRAPATEDGGLRRRPAPAEHAGGTPTVLVVAHGAVLRSAVAQLLGREGEDFAALARIDNARAAVLEGAFPDGDAGLHGPARPRAWGRWDLLGYNV